MHKLAIGNWNEKEQWKRRRKDTYLRLEYLCRRKCFYKCRDNPSEALDCRRVDCHALKGVVSLWSFIRDAVMNIKAR